jgi:type I restriction enzyme S subunit
MKPNYHLNYGKKRIERALRNNKPFESLADITSSVYTGGIFKRVFVEDEKFGLPYISAQHMMNADPLDVAKIISRKYTPRQNDMTLRDTQILVSCAGTVGNVKLVGEDLDGVIGSQDIIRILADNNLVPYGYIYAYLASPTAYNYIQSFIYGSVVPRISPGGLGKLPVPILPESKQQQIHKLIVEASKLRVEANKLLKEAVEHFDKLKIDYSYGTSTSSKISIDRINSGYKRFDSLFSIVSEKVEDSINTNNLISVEIKSQASDIFIGPRTKRNFIEKGTPFLTTSAMQKANPTKADRFMGKGSAEDFIVKEGWILTTRSGTLGDTSYVLPCISGYAVSEDAIRIVLKDDSEITKEYLYAFLKSKIGKSALLSGSYGSVIQHLNENYIGDIKVPILNKEIVNLINSKIRNHIKFFNEAILKENQAINHIENEIESWQTS